MHVTLSFQTEAFFSTTFQLAFDSYFKKEISKADLAAILGLDSDLLNQLLADLFETALLDDSIAARIEVRP